MGDRAGQQRKDAAVLRGFVHVLLCLNVCASELQIVEHETVTCWIDEIGMWRKLGRCDIK